MISRDTAFIAQGIHRTSITNRLLTAARVHTVTQSQPAKSDKNYINCTVSCGVAMIDNMLVTASRMHSTAPNNLSVTVLSILFYQFTSFCFSHLYGLF